MLDTNVVVSALLNSFGKPARGLDLALAGELVMTYDDRVFSEWRAVLVREKFGFATADVDSLLAFFEEEGLRITASPLAVELPDADDLLFLEVAREAGATLVAGNLKHYPPESRQGVEVTEPAAFLDEWTSGRGNWETEEGGDDG